jgi:hypothetical protein
LLEIASLVHAEEEDIEGELEDIDDSDLDPDYNEPGKEDSSSSSNEDENVNLVYMQPPIERPDGDTDVDSGKFYKIFYLL